MVIGSVYNDCEDIMPKREMGHKLLARLGKTKLRPGGVEGTNWLLSHVDFTTRPRVLEVACNRGYTLMQLAKGHGLHVVGIDSDPEAITTAKEGISKEGLSDLIDVSVADATNLPFEDGSFDVLINEAMLTMLPDTVKKKALVEYRRVLAPQGMVLTHDVVFWEKKPAVLRLLQKVINVPVHPLTLDAWKELFEESGLAVSDSKTGAFTLLSDEGLVRDEGKEGRDTLIDNAMADDNFGQFSEMRTFFDLAKNDIGYVVMVGTPA